MGAILNSVCYSFTHGFRDASDPSILCWRIYICHQQLSTPTVPDEILPPCTLTRVTLLFCRSLPLAQVLPLAPGFLAQHRGQALTHLHRQKASCKRLQSILKLSKLINLKKCLSSFGLQGQCTWR